MERQNDSNNSVVVIFCTFPDADKARQIGTVLVESQLAACVNITPLVESIYRWEGTVQQENEALGIFKTTQGKLVDFEKMLLKIHPYEVPELIVLPVLAGSAAYLDWVKAETR